MKGWKIFGVFFFGAAALGGMANVFGSASAGDAVKNLIVVVISFIIAAFLAWSVWIKPRELKQEMAERKAELEARAQEVERSITLPVVDHPSVIIVKSGETCHFQSQAKTLIVKNQVVGREGEYGGSSFRVTKRVAWHSGGSKSRTIRDNVAYTYPGVFSLTNQRIIMTGEKGFEYSLDKLTAAVIYGEYQGCVLQFGQNSYTILMDEPYWVPKIVELLRK